MKHLFLFLLLITVFSSCSESPEEKASLLLTEAREATECNNFSKARELIDSLRSAYPKAIKTRREALLFVDSLELLAAKHEQRATDSLLVIKSAELEAMKKEFTFEKDEKYQTVGHYISPNQSGQNARSSSIKAQVNEEGLMVLISLLKDKKISHKSISISLPTGENAETPQCFSHLTHSIKGYTEESSYKIGEDGGVIQFIVDMPGTMTVTYKGEKSNYKTQLSPTDKFAVKHCYILYLKFAEVKELKAKLEKLSLKVRFYEKKISITNETKS